MNDGERFRIIRTRDPVTREVRTTVTSISLAEQEAEHDREMEVHQWALSLTGEASYTGSIRDMYARALRVVMDRCRLSVAGRRRSAARGTAWAHQNTPW